MKTRWLILAAIGVVSIVAGVSASAAGTVGAAKPPTNKVQLGEFSIKPKLEFFAKGKIKLAVKNGGIEKHELVVVRGSDPKALPTKADGSVDEEKIAKADKRGELGELKARKTKSKVFKFPPGSYIFFCNLVDKEKDGTVVSHFARGMYVKVEAG